MWANGGPETPVSMSGFMVLSGHDHIRACTIVVEFQSQAKELGDEPATYEDRANKSNHTTIAESAV